jgi:hypothetical protein
LLDVLSLRRGTCNRNSWVVEGICLGLFVLAHRHRNLPMEGSPGAERGGFAWLLIGNIVDLELLTTVLVQVILLWRPSSCSIGLQCVFWISP